MAVLLLHTDIGEDTEAVELQVLLPKMAIDMRFQFRKFRFTYTKQRAAPNAPLFLTLLL